MGCVRISFFDGKMEVIFRFRNKEMSKSMNPTGTTFGKLSEKKIIQAKPRSASDRFSCKLNKRCILI